MKSLLGLFHRVFDFFRHGKKMGDVVTEGLLSEGVVPVFSVPVFSVPVFSEPVSSVTCEKGNVQEIGACVLPGEDGQDQHREQFCEQPCEESGEKHHEEPSEQPGEQPGEQRHEEREVTDIHDEIMGFLRSHYDLRYNVLTAQVEGRVKGEKNGRFCMIERRLLNTMVIKARKCGVNCWDRDLDRILRSNYIENYHPFAAYMEDLPRWDGVDRVTPLAKRVDESELWVNGFRLWLLGLTAQWMGREGVCANTLTPLLISLKQGMRKSSFCRLLMPPELRMYYLDKFDLTAKSNMEVKLGQFGLINLDEFDRYSSASVAVFKNLVQLKELTVRKAYANYFQQLPRIASFIGTSNQLELLNDPTGSRRFLCVEVTHPIDCSAVDHRQLFAQLKEFVEHGARVWMDSSEELEMQLHNKLFMKLRPEEELFHQVFRIPEDGEGQMYTATEIHRKLCLVNAGAMRGITVQMMGKTLSCMGLKRVHTNVGNKYRLVQRSSGAEDRSASRDRNTSCDRGTTSDRG